MSSGQHRGAAGQCVGVTYGGVQVNRWVQVSLIQTGNLLNAQLGDLFYRFSVHTITRPPVI